MTAGLLALGLALVPLAGHAATATPVPKLSTWKYLATPVAAPSDWNMLEFSDTAWAAGPGILGYGQPYITTVVPYGPDATHKYRTTYFRNAFTVSDDPATVTLLTLEVNYDDGFVAYINGVEVLRLAMPGGTISYSTLASVSHNGGSYQVIDLSSAIGQLDPGPNVLAVELHQVTDTSADLVLDMELRYETNTARITRGPYLQTGAPDRTTVRWRTNVPTDSKVFYGTAEDDLSTTAELSGSRTEHEIELTSLTADTPYFYTIGASIEVLAGPDSVASFTTAPVAGTSKPTRIWVLGDSGQPGGAPSVRNAYTTYTGERATDLWLMLGDNAYNSGTDAEYQASVFNIFGPTLKSSVLWLTRGNHDGVYAGASNDYYDIFTLPAGAQAGGLPSGSEAYYSFDYGDIHFICLDSEGTDRSIGGAMMRWLREDLAASPRLWNIAFWHHPPYTKGSHDSDNEFDSGGRMRDMRQNALPALDSAGVDLVLTGHSHSYERSFLLRGHYGTSGTLTPEMKVDPGNGRLLEDGAYVKPDGAAGTLDGAVYAVAGSSSQISGGSLNHPVMVTSMNVMGSMVIDVDGGRLDARFLSNTGALLDSFTIVKGVPLAAHPSPPAPALRLALAGLHPGTEEVRLSYSVPAPGPARLAILDAAGRRVATVLDQVVEPGPQVAVWRSRDGRGRLVASGIYFAVLESAGERRVVKIVRSR